jgi:hypothetical protein
LLLPIDGNDDDALTATAAATINLFVNSDYNFTLDGNPIPSSEPLVLHHFDPLYAMILNYVWRLGCSGA